MAEWLLNEPTASTYFLLDHFTNTYTFSENVSDCCFPHLEVQMAPVHGQSWEFTHTPSSSSTRCPSTHTQESCFAVVPHFIQFCSLSDMLCRQAGIHSCSAKGQIPQTFVQVSTMLRFSSLGNPPQEEVVMIASVPGGERSHALQMRCTYCHPPAPHHMLKREFLPDCCEHLSSL